MSIPVVNIKLDTKRLDQIAAGLNKNTDQVLGMLAFQVESYAKQIVLYDTHNLQNSIKAERLGELHWWIRDETTYGIHVEFPGVTRNWSGAPFMVPAAYRVEWELNSGQTWERLFK